MRMFAVALRFRHFPFRNRGLSDVSDLLRGRPGSPGGLGCDAVVPPRDKEVKHLSHVGGCRTARNAEVKGANAQHSGAWA
jgi:hypothetical protein